MTSSLARLLRQSISNEDELVSIKREVDYARSYLTIQKMRYQDKMEFEIHVEEEILEQQIIKLVLQPVVENAIYHGIKYKDGKGSSRSPACTAAAALTSLYMITVKGWNRRFWSIFLILKPGTNPNPE